jgi:hypothetical protein
MNKWFAPQMPPQEVVRLRKQLALIIGYNETTGKLEALGTGVVVAVPVLHVITAAHVLWEFAKAVYGPAPRTGLSMAGSDPADEYPRMDRIMRARALAAVIESEDGAVHAFRVDELNSGMDRRNDIALLRLDIRDPWFVAHPQVVPLPPDLANIDVSEPYLLAGFVGMPRDIDIDEPEGEARMRASSRLIVRGAWIDQVTTEAPGMQPGVETWKLLVPTEHGMSGGPLMRQRGPWGERLFGGAKCSLLTAVGVISYGMPDSAVGDDGYTWVSAISELRQLPSSLGPGLSAVVNMAAMVITYQDIEERLKTIDPRQAAYGFNPWPIMREKLLKLAKPLTDEYLRFFSKWEPGKSPPLETLSAPRGLISEMLWVSIWMTTDDETRRHLEQAYLSFAFLIPPGTPPSEWESFVARDHKERLERLSKTPPFQDNPKGMTTPPLPAQ